LALYDSALLLTRLGITNGDGHWNNKKLVESNSYKFMCSTVFRTGLQECGQRANDEWPNGQGKKSRQLAGGSGQQAEKSQMRSGSV
jgi:hypothetical protein